MHSPGEVCNIPTRAVERNGNDSNNQTKWAVSSGGEHYLDTVGVTSSNLVSPTIHICGHGSVGRAPPCQGGGRGFEPRCPLQKSYSRGKRLGCFFVFEHGAGLEPMRWNSVKKTAQWAVFRNSPEGFSLRGLVARSADRNPLQATIECCRPGDCLACFG